MSEKSNSEIIHLTDNKFDIFVIKEKHRIIIRQGTEKTPSIAGRVVASFFFFILVLFCIGGLVLINFYILPHVIAQLAMRLYFWFLFLISILLGIAVYFQTYYRIMRFATQFDDDLLKRILYTRNARWYISSYILLPSFLVPILIVALTSMFILAYSNFLVLLQLYLFASWYMIISALLGLTVIRLLNLSLLALKDRYIVVNTEEKSLVIVEDGILKKTSRRFSYGDTKDIIGLCILPPTEGSSPDDIASLFFIVNSRKRLYISIAGGSLRIIRDLVKILQSIHPWKIISLGVL